MRDPNFNVPAGVAGRFPAELSLEIYRKMCLVRFFEMRAIEAVSEKRLKYLVYLSLGQEAVAAALATQIRDYQIFAQHRCHDLYLSFGGKPEALRDELMGLPGGTSKGRAGSNNLQWFENGISMYGHHGLIGENVPQGVGAALGNGRRTLCVFGDGAAEEDYIFPSLGFAVTHKLPVLFVCIDNNLSVLTTKEYRRNWNMTEVAKSFGMPAVEVADDPWTVVEQARELTNQLPAFMNCFVCRERWHVGVGCDGPPEWQRFELVRSEPLTLGHQETVEAIENEVREEMGRLWAPER